MRTNLNKNPIWLKHSEQSGALQEVEIEKLGPDSARSGRLTKEAEFQSKCSGKPLKHLQWWIKSLPNDSESL